MESHVSVLGTHLRGLVEALSRGLVEREQAVRIALLATLAGENVLLLGPPGTAKSLIARRISLAFRGKRPFQYLLTRFTTPDELFGPVSLRELKDNDAFRRKVDGYLPSAEVAFLDEIFKASSAILNALLTLINERLFFNGSDVMKVPLLALVAASNETPEDESLLALFDRFSVRLVVDRISSEQAFLEMLAASEQEDEGAPADGLALEPDSVHLIRKASRAVRLPPGVRRLIARVKSDLEKLMREASEDDAYRFYVSDRRWRQAARLLRTSAYVHGRDEVDELDCALLQHCLWNQPEDAERIRALLDRAFEDFRVTFDLRLDGVARRWWDLLVDMRNHAGVAEPIYAGHTVRAGDKSFDVSDKELEAWKRNDAALVFKSGIAFDAQVGRFRMATRLSDGSFRMYSNTRVSDEATLRQRITAGDRPDLEDSQTVELSRRKQRGAVLRFEAVHPAVNRHWTEAAVAVQQELAEQAALRDSAGRKLEARVAAHLFVHPEQVRGLRLGLAQAALAIEEWKKKLEHLQGALAARGQFSTQDIDHAAGSDERDGWRRLVAAPSRSATPGESGAPGPG